MCSVGEAVKKKVVYLMGDLKHRRVFQSFQEHPGLEQVVVGPNPKKTYGIVQDYSNFGIKTHITHDLASERYSAVANLNADVLVMSGRFNEKINNCTKDIPKKVFVDHGFTPEHMFYQYEPGSIPGYDGFDLYCGDNFLFKDWVRHIIGSERNVLTNALPQLDVLYNQKIIDKNILLRHFGIKRKFDKIILFPGFCCRETEDYYGYNEEFFRIFFELERISRKRNWLFITTIRHKMARLKRIISNRETLRNLKAVAGSRFVLFLDNYDDIYHLYFADAILTNGCSSIEIESFIAGKPIFIVKESVPVLDSYGTIASGGAFKINSVPHIIKHLDVFFKVGGGKYLINQKKYLDENGIINDGTSCKRIQDYIIQNY